MHLNSYLLSIYIPEAMLSFRDMEINETVLILDTVNQPSSSYFYLIIYLTHLLLSDPSSHDLATIYPPASFSDLAL